VTLTNPSAAKPTFVAPVVGRAGTLLTFALTVSDGQASASATATVTVEHVNHPPTANAGPDQTRQEGSVVTLDGRGSQDPDGDGLRYAWSQLSGPAVTLTGATTATPTFVAPPVGPGGATLVFRLVVSDGLAESLPDDVTITVLHLNQPPVCDRAAASPAVLWPPNHKLVAVAIVGVSDPDNTQVTLTVTGVTQDEAVNGLGDGDTSPDAVVQGSLLALRAERSGSGNGRVYTVSFRAANSRGDTCTGRVTVCVPHDQKPATCVDDGQRFDALRP